MDSEPLTRDEQELLAQCARGRATRVIASLYRRAEKRNALMELEPEDEFRIWRLRWKLGTLLALGRRVSIVPVIPFEEGGLFHPSNLKIARIHHLRSARHAQHGEAAAA